VPEDSVVATGAAIELLFGASDFGEFDTVFALDRAGDSVADGVED
jgi:hypothetical protein